MNRFTILAVLVFVSASAFAFSNEKPAKDNVSKSLAFPVWGKKNNIGSFWGDVRDGGKRKHRGIDIFAKKGTPVVAIADGIIISKGNTPRGGKTLWLQTAGYGWRVYYAHLDEHKARVGQIVKKGDIIGTVGNTGNARTTPPHLHFGIYSWLGGAINPLPYVKNAPRVTTPYSVTKIQPAVAKADKKPAASVSKKETVDKTTSGYVFPSQYIAKTITLPADPSAKYYVTTKSNVVRVYGSSYTVVGKWTKYNHSKYPYKIALVNQQPVYVDKAGKLVTDKGVRIGSVI